jgi:sensor histidine kinase YesM/tetratricopeptide (TPR) repeat protein
LLLTVYFMLTPVHAQQKKIDSLWQVLAKHKKDDVGKIEILYNIGMLSVYSNPQKVNWVAEELRIISEKTNIPAAKFHSLQTKAIYYQITLKLDSAISTYKKASAYAIEIKEPERAAAVNGNIASILLVRGKSKEAIELLKESIANISNPKDADAKGKLLTNLANAYNVIGDRVLALKTALQALAIHTQYNDLNSLSITNYLIGSLYGISSQFNEALQYHIGYTNIQLQLNNWSNACSGLIAVANDYSQLKKTDSAVTNLNKALQIAKNYKFTAQENKIQLLLNDINAQQSKTEAEIVELEQQKKYYAANAMQQDLGLILCRLGMSYTKLSDNYFGKKGLDKENRQQIAIGYINEAMQIANKSNNYGLKEEATRTLSLYYEAQQDYIKAYSTYKQYVLLRDSAINESQQVELSKLNLQYSFKVKEDSLKLIQATTDATLQKQFFLNKQQEQNLLLQSKVLLLNKQTILNNDQELAILNKDKELQHLAFLKTQADLQTEQLLKAEKDVQLTLIQKEKLLETAKVKNLSQENEFNKLKKKQIVGYGIAALATLLFGGLYLYNRNKNKQAQLKAELAKEKAEQQTKEAEFQKSLTDVSLSALRSQMNPHFIFNCLNSIKLYTAQNDTVAAGNYLTKFSKLIRMALENSRSETVNLQNEIESLELYIQMEAMRFKDKLKYTITVDKTVDADFIEIPPMLLQPYIENAIWHGLMHKEEGGNIAVAIKNTTANDALVITIADDGVGREKSAQLRSKTSANHKSFGTKVTSERLALINKLYKTEASVTTEDIVKDNLVAGTLVTVKIPFA